MPENNHTIRKEFDDEDARENTSPQSGARIDDELLRLIVESVEDYAIIATDTQGRVVSWNAGAQNIFGYTESEVAGRSGSIIFTPEDIEDGVPEQELRTAAAEGKAVDERWHVRKDGTRFWASGMVTPLRDGEGNPRGFVKVARDATASKLMREALSASEEQYRIVAETATDAIITIDEKSTILFVNQAAEKIFGYTISEMKGASLSTLMPEYLRHLHQAGIKRYLNTGQRHVSWESVELPGLHKDGREFPLEISFGEYYREGKHLFTGICRDILERKRVQSRVATQHAVTQVLSQSQNVVEATPKVIQAICESLGWDVGGLWRLHPGENRLRCAEAWKSPSIADDVYEDICSKHPLAPGVGLPGRVWKSGELVWITDISAEENFPRAELARRAGLHSAFAFPIHIGSEVIGVMEFFSRTAKERDEDVIEMVSTLGSQVGQFIERRRAENALREAEGRAVKEYERLLVRLSSLAQSLGAANDLPTIFHALRQFAVISVPCSGMFISLYDDRRKVRTAAYAWSDGEEVDVRALPPMPMNDSPHSRAVATGEVIITDDFQSAMSDKPRIDVGLERDPRLPQSSLAVPMFIMGRVVGGVEVQSTEPAAYRTEHATAMQLAANLVAVAIENARLLEQERHALTESENAHRLKDEFLATLSHELRTPLTAILGWSNMLRSNSFDKEATENALETIARNARAQVQLIDDLLDVSRIITGKLRLDVRAVDLPAVVRAAADTLRPASQAKDIHLQVLLDPSAGPLSGDPDRLQQVVWNLVSNAIKFTPKGGRVQVRLERVNSHIEIVVADTGAGIAAEFLPLVFDRFRQADQTVTRKHGGLGLGLAIVRQLVELHGGTVKVESAGEGRGATFTVSLPLLPVRVDKSEPEDERVHPKAQSGAIVECPPELNDLHVLVIDDEPDTRELLAAILSNCGAQVSQASSAAEGLDLLGRGRFDVLVSDIGMPGEDGYSFIRKVRALSPERGGRTPAAALTAYAREEDRIRALRAGYQIHVPKPVSPAELATVVANLAGRTE